ncbi:hypothetical protein ACFXPF_37175, partial [Streptomyces sp. NPDC059131]
SVTGVRLPATLVFDHPSPQAITAYLHTTLTPQDHQAQEGRPVLDGLDGLEVAITNVSADDVAMREEIENRLRGLLRIVESKKGETDQNMSSRILSASAEELFDLVDRGFGGSPTTDGK